MMHNKRSSSKQSSVATIGGNDDLLMEILIFLPAKSLMRFKLVSKHWSSLISDTSFILRHCRRAKPQHSFILRVSGMTQQFFVCNSTIKRLIPYRFTWPFVKILQSCNGLLLLECRKFKEGYKEYFVFNPTTMQYRDLNIYGGLGTYSGISLIFDPSKSHHYRVVRFRSDNSTKFFVYDSMTHSWNDGGEFHEGPSKYNDGVCWNDHLYFIKHSNTTSFCFSPEEKLVSIHSPNTPRVRGRKNYTVESDGHLHCLSLYPKQDKIHLRIFEMMTDNNWWIGTRSDSKRVSATFDGDNTKEIELLGMIREEREEDSMLLIHVPGKILIYRFSNEVSEVLVDFTRDYIYQEGRLQFEFKDAHPFIDSLAPV